MKYCGDIYLRTVPKFDIKLDIWENDLYNHQAKRYGRRFFLNLKVKFTAQLMFNNTLYYFNQLFQNTPILFNLFVLKILTNLYFFQQLS